MYCTVILLLHHYPPLLPSALPYRHRLLVARVGTSRLLSCSPVCSVFESQTLFCPLSCRRAFRPVPILRCNVYSEENDASKSFLLSIFYDAPWGDFTRYMWESGNMSKQRRDGIIPHSSSSSSLSCSCRNWEVHRHQDTQSDEDKRKNRTFTRG